MSVKEKLRKALLIAAVGFALIVVPMKNPQEIEEILRQVNVPKVAETLPQRGDAGDQ